MTCNDPTWDLLKEICGLLKKICLVKTCGSLTKLEKLNNLTNKRKLINPIWFYPSEVN